MAGKVYLVGSGPGGIGLLTKRGYEVISMAEVILFDQLPGRDILSSLPDHAERIDCGKFGNRHTLEQDEIEALMVRRAREGRTVVRLKGGDPFVFGRGGEELETLRAAGIETEVVPGVTSAVAVPAAVGIPVTHRKYASAVTVITGHEDPQKEDSALDWECLAKLKGTLVILMGVKNLPVIARTLIGFGKDPETPVAIIENGLRSNQRVVSASLARIADVMVLEKVTPPAVIVIGEVVTLYRPEDPPLVRMGNE